MTVHLSLPHLSQPLKLWEKLELVTGEGDETGIYIARIEDFIAQGIVISSPEFVKGHSLLRENAKVLIVFTKDDAAYQCHSRIKRYPIDGKNLYLLSKPNRTKRVQRRQFVRVDMLKCLEYARLSPVMDWENYDDHLEWFSTTTDNMSGGGVMIKIDEELKLELENRVFMKIGFFPGQGLPDMVAGVVRRVFTLEKRIMAGIEFIVSDRLGDYFKSDDLAQLPASVKRFDRRTQNRLVSYIFQQEIELRKKGLL
jgi:c-di-GMP-binding flagellar brake protein YcgR